LHTIQKIESIQQHKVLTFANPPSSHLPRKKKIISSPHVTKLSSGNAGKQNYISEQTQHNRSFWTVSGYI